MWGLCTRYTPPRIEPMALPMLGAQGAEILILHYIIVQ